MNKGFLFLLMLLSATAVVAQTYPEDFPIPLSDQIVHNSLYKTIDFVDTRPYDGLLNRKPKYITAMPIGNQLKNLMKTLTDSTAKEGSLLLQLRLFNFAEITGTASEKGNFYLRAVLYSKINGYYQKINSLDTVVARQTGINLSKPMLENGGEIISRFIMNSLLLTPPDSTSFSLQSVKKLDSIEKQKIPLYTAVTYKDGIYFSYGSFKNQIPDQQIKASITADSTKLFAVKTIENGKKKHINPKDAYAAVYKGVPYIATKYGYYPAEKINNDFFFTGDIAMRGNAGDVTAGFIMLGVVGGGLATLPDEEVYYMRIDHTNGEFVRIQERPDAQFHPGF
jgi:hypothetical protein